MTMLSCTDSLYVTCLLYHKIVTFHIPSMHFSHLLVIDYLYWYIIL